VNEMTRDEPFQQNYKMNIAQLYWKEPELSRKHLNPG
jgi:hypothetical protein